MGTRFTGTLGIFVKDGRIAFFRRWSAECLNTLRAVADFRSTTFGAFSDDEEDDGVSLRKDALECVAAATHGMPPDAAEPAWETTGFCSTFWWATGAKLAMCIAFRDDGPYRVSITKICREPPASPESSRPPRFIDVHRM